MLEKYEKNVKMRSMFKYIFSFLVFLPSICFAEINVAVIAPRDGEYQEFGNQILGGAKIAIDNINNNGGLNGKKLKLVEVDDQCDDKIAISTAQMIAVNRSQIDKISLVIGPYCTNSFAAVADIYAKANIFQIIPTTVSASQAQTSRAGLVKMLGSNDRQLKDFYQYYTSSFAGSSVALVYDGGNKEIVQMARVLQTEFRVNDNSHLLNTFNFENYDKNYSKMAKEITQKNVKVVYILGKSKPIGRLAKEIKSKNKDLALFIDKYQAEPAYQKIMGNLADGSYVMALPSLKSSPNFTEDLVNLRLQGIEPQGLGVYSYNAIKLWQDLVQKSKSFSYSKLSQNLATQNSSAPNTSYGIYQISGEEYTQVY